MAQLRLKSIQRGLEATAGTAVPATFKHIGRGRMLFDTKVEQPEVEAATGVFGGNVEGGFISQDETVFTLDDYDFSFEDMVWLGNHAIKTVVGPATNFPFTFPTTSVNTRGAFTYELATATQEYEAAYCFVEEFEVHGDAEANNGRLYTNAKLRGRAASASTATAALGPLANLQYATVHQCSFHMDALGTAAGTAAASTSLLKGFSIRVVTGQKAGHYADGRQTKDFATEDFDDYVITGRARLALSAAAVTRIANLRAATGEVIQIKVTGTAARIAKFNLPLLWTSVEELGEDTANGLLLVNLNFRSGYSRTVTAQGPSVDVTLSASATVT